METLVLGRAMNGLERLGMVGTGGLWEENMCVLVWVQLLGSRESTNCIDGDVLTSTQAEVSKIGHGFQVVFQALKIMEVWPVNVAISRCHSWRNPVSHFYNSIYTVYSNMPMTDYAFIPLRIQYVWGVCSLHGRKDDEFSGMIVN